MNGVIGMDDDLKILDSFLGDLDRLLNFAFEERNSLISPDLVGFLAEAWPSYMNRMASLRAQLVAFAPEEMGLLAFHGLTGPELRLKMAGFYGSVNDFDIELNAYRVSSDREPSSILRAKLSDGLAWGNIILSSLPIPGKGAIEEIKKVVERAMKDSENPWRTQVPSIAPR